MSKYHLFLQCKIIRNPASKSLQSAEISLYLAFTNELNVAQKEKNIDEWLILPNNTILLIKSQLVTSYTLKHDVNRCFWNPAWSKCKHVYKPVGSFINNRVCKYHWSYCNWALYCNLTIAMIRKYLKGDKYWSIVWIFAMASNFSYFEQ